MINLTQIVNNLLAIKEFFFTNIQVPLAPPPSGLPRLRATYGGYYKRITIRRIWPTLHSQGVSIPVHLIVSCIGAAALSQNQASVTCLSQHFIMDINTFYNNAYCDGLLPFAIKTLIDNTNRCMLTIETLFDAMTYRCVDGCTPTRHGCETSEVD